MLRGRRVLMGLGVATALVIVTMILMSLEATRMVPTILATTDYDIAKLLRPKFDQELNKLVEQIKDSLSPNLAQIEFFTDVFRIMVDAEPKIGKLDNYREGLRPPNVFISGDDDNDSARFDESYLGGFLQVDDHQISTLKKSHAHVVNNLPTQVPPNVYSGDGIVFVGGGKFNWLTLLSLQALRDTGCSLPVEVLIPTSDEYEPKFCGNVLPNLNAKCIHMPLMLPNYARNHFQFKGYQFKLLALLLLSFERALLLDSDNLPVRDPTPLFDSVPFQLGLVVWPDFWKRVTLPAFFKIADHEVSLLEVYPRYDAKLNGYVNEVFSGGVDYVTDVPLHRRKGAMPDPSTELGQVLISKRSHVQPLLLALYYNLYGPNHYYPILSQGAAGEGDKETFLAATTVTNHSFYQVTKFVTAVGWWQHEDFHGVAMGQYDAIADHAFQAGSTDNTPQLMFLHSNYPKLDPHKLENDRTIYDGDNRIRMYGKTQRGIGDFELKTWQNMHLLLCQQKIRLDWFKDVDHSSLCDGIVLHVEFLEQDKMED